MLNTAASARKEDTMTSEFEIETFLKMILEILKSCKDLQEAIKKIEALLQR